MTCEYGFCSVCDKEIAKKDLNGARRPTNDYTEVQMAWSNGSRMQVAVCTECAVTHKWCTSEAKDGITKAHWDAWDKQGGLYDKAVVLV